MMRTVCGILVFFAVAACTGQANTAADSNAPRTIAVAAVSQTANNTQALLPDGTINPKIMQDAKKRGYTVVNEDGKVLYCRSDYKTGSHVQKETSCLTADELASLHDRTQLGLSTIARPTLPPSGH